MSGNLYCQVCGSECEVYLDGHIKREACPNCGFIYYRNPYPCVSVLVIDDNGRVLLGKRSEKSIYPYKWCLPCGYIEYEETYIEAAIREVKEETGVSINPISIVNVVSNHLDNGVNSIVTVLLAEPETITIVPGDDITEADWFDIDKSIPELAFDADRFIINEYKCSRKKNLKMKGIDLQGCCF